MMRLDTNPKTPGPRGGQGAAAGIPMLIQVPRVDEPMGRSRFWASEVDRRGGRARRGSSRTTPAGSLRAPGRPRRRLRRGVRLASGVLLMLAAMAGTFTLGWTTRGGGPSRLPLMRTAALDRDAVGGAPGLGAEPRSSAEPLAPVVEAAGDADALATGTSLDAPVADAEVPVIFRGYLLPDNNREEPAHEGS